MPPENADSAYLWDMLEHARILRDIVANSSLEAVLGDRKLQLSIERAIEIIGEAARNVSDEFETAHPEIPWKAIVAQRHVLAHEYGEIMHDRLWKVATVHVPTLIEQLEAILPRDKQP